MKLSEFWRSMEELLRIPGIGTTSALRILRQRRLCQVQYDDLKKMGVVLKRAKHFLTCAGKYHGEGSFFPVTIRRLMLEGTDGQQLSLFQQQMVLPEQKKVLLNG